MQESARKRKFALEQGLATENAREADIEVKWLQSPVRFRGSENPRDGRTAQKHANPPGGWQCGGGHEMLGMENPGDVMGLACPPGR